MVGKQHPLTESHVVVYMNIFANYKQFNMYFNMGDDSLETCFIALISVSS